MVGKYPEALITRDKWGDVPLFYAIWCNAPSEILNFLVDRYKSLYPDFEFDWASMIKTMCEAFVPLRIIQRVVNVQQNSFPDQHCDMQHILTELARSDSTVYQAASHLTASERKQQSLYLCEVMQYLLRIGVSDRLDELNVERWRFDIEKQVEGIERLISGAINDVQDVSRLAAYTSTVYARLALYESVKEASTILELSLWKAKIDEYGNGHRDKRAKASHEVDQRSECRVNCGAAIVIPNVLRYLPLPP